MVLKINGISSKNGLILMIDKEIKCLAKTGAYGPIQNMKFLLRVSICVDFNRTLQSGYVDYPFKGIIAG